MSAGNLYCVGLYPDPNPETVSYTQPCTESYELCMAMLLIFYHIPTQNATKFLFCCVGDIEYQYSKGFPALSDGEIFIVFLSR